MDAWNLGWTSSNVLKNTELRTVLLLGTQRAHEADVLDVWGDLPPHHHFVGCSYPLPITFQGLSPLDPTKPPQGEPQQNLITGLWLTYSGATVEAGEIRMILKLPLRKYARPPAPRCHAVAPPPPQPCCSLAWRQGALPATCLPARLPRAALPLELQQPRREGFGTHVCICMCMYVYVYVYVCICICMYMYIYLYLYMYMYLYLYM